MTPEAQRIALCEWAGWTDIKEDKFGLLGWHERIDGRNALWMRDSGLYLYRLPDTDSLDVLHEMESLLVQGDYNFQKRDKYAAELRMIIGPHGNMRSFDYAHAGAAQRREALLRTLGLWKDETT